MKKKCIALLVLAALTLSACGSEASVSPSVSREPMPTISISEEPVTISVSKEEEPEPEPVVEETREGMYRSELTNEWISEDIENQRPVAIMVDNDKVAQPHYGTSQSDVVYELVNSTLNNRVTRLMCIVKDWKNIEVFGNIRSTRPTNCILFPEYNAILVHDGGPYYINDWLAFPNATNHLNGGFARIDRTFKSGNAKDSTYEEYVTAENYTGVGGYAGKSWPGLLNRIAKAGYTEEYNQYYMGKHFTFSNELLSIEKEKNAQSITHVALPYGHNQSELKYNKDTGLYDFYEFGEIYKDAANDSTLSFANVIIYTCSLFEYEKDFAENHGYMLFNCIGNGDGYYLTGGNCIPIKWNKPAQEALTSFTNAATGEEIVLNTGKTYITIVPSDSWDRLVLE